MAAQEVLKNGQLPPSRTIISQEVVTDEERQKPSLTGNDSIALFLFAPHQKSEKLLWTSLL